MAERSQGFASLGKSQGSDGLARGELRKNLVLGGFVGCEFECTRREHGTPEIRSAKQRPAHLFCDDRELDHPQARAAVPLGNDQSDDPEFLGHAAPGRRVIALLAHHQLANAVLVRFLLEKIADGSPQLAVLVTEFEEHVPSFLYPDSSHANQLRNDPNSNRLV